MLLRQIFDPYLAQYSYLLGCQKTGEALIIDPERDIDRYQHLAKKNNLQIAAVAETHIHADFISGAQEFSADPNVYLYLSAEGGTDWQYVWPKTHPNTQFLKDGDRFMVGKIQVEAVYTPGHTPEHLSYLITDLGGGADQPVALVTGDFLFVGDVGRPDLLESAAGVKNVMEPSARQLCKSLNEKLSNLEPYLQILPGHGAGSACGKSLGAIPTTTLGYERLFNVPLKLALEDEDSFVSNILLDQPEPPLYFATMKRVNRDGIRITNGSPDVRKIANQELVDILENDSIKILDARVNRKDFDRRQIKGAINAPLNSPFYSSSAGSYLGESDLILLCVEKEYDIDLAIRQLYRIGFDKIVGWVCFSEIENISEIMNSIDRIEFSNFDPQAALDQGEIIDVRTSGEFRRGHIEGARSFPYTRIKSKLDEISKESYLYIYCGSGRRATLAASFLKSQGYRVCHVDGVCSECKKISEQEGVPH